MNFIIYQTEAIKTLKVSEKEKKEPLLLLSRLTNGLCSEAGEFAGKIDKIIRDKDGEISQDDIRLLSKELGDILWAIAVIAYKLGIELPFIARQNIMKLQSRDARGKISGSGDER